MHHQKKVAVRVMVQVPAYGKTRLRSMFHDIHHAGIRKSRLHVQGHDRIRLRRRERRKINIHRAGFDGGRIRSSWLRANVHRSDKSNRAVRNSNRPFADGEHQYEYA